VQIQICSSLFIVKRRTNGGLDQYYKLLTVTNCHLVYTVPLLVFFVLQSCGENLWPCLMTCSTGLSNARLVPPLATSGSLRRLHEPCLDFHSFLFLAQISALAVLSFVSPMQLQALVHRLLALQRHRCFEFAMSPGRERLQAFYSNYDNNQRFNHGHSSLPLGPEKGCSTVNVRI
jgi:hypothetical protein